jgi:pimeloyl-ACP methyl ester carboxylesterase
MTGMLRPPLLLLHGAIGASRQLTPLRHVLDAHCLDIRLYDFPGHGGLEIPVASFSIRAFAESIVQRMDQQGLDRVDIFGYSMGGYVGLYLALHYPQRIGRICTLATKFAWNAATADKESRLLDPDAILNKVPHFAKTLEERHAPQDWKRVLKATTELMQNLGQAPELADDDFIAIQHPVLLIVGDRDTMVTMEETLHVYRKLPAAQLTVLPNTGHPIEQLDLQRLSELLRRFFY